MPKRSRRHWFSATSSEAGSNEPEGALELRETPWDSVYADPTPGPLHHPVVEQLISTWAALPFDPPNNGMTQILLPGNWGSERCWTFPRSQNQEEDLNPDLHDSKPILYLLTRNSPHFPHQGMCSEVEAGCLYNSFPVAILKNSIRNSDYWWSLRTWWFYISQL